MVRFYIQSACYVFIILISSCNLTNKNDFEIFCDFVTELEMTEKFTTENLTVNYTNLADHIGSSLTYGSNIRSAFSGVANVNPEDKYILFKEVAESVTKKTWSCKPLQRFYLTTEY